MSASQFPLQSKQPQKRCTNCSSKMLAYTLPLFKLINKRGGEIRRGLALREERQPHAARQLHSEERAVAYQACEKGHRWATVWLIS